jgi:hypothetical protein
MPERIRPSHGHNAGAQVEILTRPGTNQLHGALFDFLRNDVFDARNYFARHRSEKTFLQRNQFGFVLSGPVWISKGLQRSRSDILDGELRRPAREAGSSIDRLSRA